jgi:arginyl-tRNA synthetase
MHDVRRRNEEKYNLIEDSVRAASLLAISAIMAQHMAGKKISNYEFNLERMTSFEWDTSPYLQYAHAQLCSVFRKIDVIRE